MLLQNGSQPDINQAESYHSMNYDYGHRAQYCDNGSCQAPPPAAEVGHRIGKQLIPVLTPAPLKNLGTQCAYHRNPNIDSTYPSLGGDQGNLVASGSSHMEYYSTQAHVRPFSRLVHTVLVVSDCARTVGRAKQWW